LEDSFAELKAVTTPAQYADNLNAWIAFYAHLGRIHDMAEKAAAQFQGEGLFVPFDSFNEKRHTVLHYPKVPMYWAESVLASPRLGETPRDWKQGMRWSELDHQGFEFLCDIVASTLRDLEKVINAFMYRIAELVTLQLQFVPVEWPEASQTFHKSVLSPPPSGARFEVAVEANDSLPLSGTLNVRVRERQ
jgi:hypothetical protein